MDEFVPNVYYNHTITQVFRFRVVSVLFAYIWEIHNIKNHQKPRAKPTCWAWGPKMSTFTPPTGTFHSFFSNETLYTPIWVDLDTYIGHMTHLKKWSFFHWTPYWDAWIFNSYKPIGPTAWKSVQGRLLYHL